MLALAPPRLCVWSFIWLVLAGEPTVAAVLKAAVLKTWLVDASGRSTEDTAAPGAAAEADGLKSTGAAVLKTWLVDASGRSTEDTAAPGAAAEADGLKSTGATVLKALLVNASIKDRRSVADGSNWLNSSIATAAQQQAQQQELGSSSVLAKVASVASVLVLADRDSNSLPRWQWHTWFLTVFLSIIVLVMLIVAWRDVHRESGAPGRNWSGAAASGSLAAPSQQQQPISAREADLSTAEFISEAELYRNAKLRTTIFDTYAVCSALMVGFCANQQTGSITSSDVLGGSVTLRYFMRGFHQMMLHLCMAMGLYAMLVFMLTALYLKTALSRPDNGLKLYAFILERTAFQRQRGFLCMYGTATLFFIALTASCMAMPLYMERHFVSSFILDVFGLTTAAVLFGAFFITAVHTYGILSTGSVLWLPDDKAKVSLGEFSVAVDGQQGIGKLLTQGRYIPIGSTRKSRREVDAEVESDDDSIHEEVADAAADRGV